MKNQTEEKYLIDSLYLNAQAAPFLEKGLLKILYESEQVYIADYCGSCYLAILKNLTVQNTYFGVRISAAQAEKGTTNDMYLPELIRLTAQSDRLKDDDTVLLCNKSLEDAEELHRQISFRGLPSELDPAVTELLRQRNRAYWKEREPSKKKLSTAVLLSVFLFTFGAGFFYTGHFILAVLSMAAVLAPLAFGLYFVALPIGVVLMILVPILLCNGTLKDSKKKRIFPKRKLQEYALHTNYFNGPDTQHSVEAEAYGDNAVQSHAENTGLTRFQRFITNYVTRGFFGFGVMIAGALGLLFPPLFALIPIGLIFFLHTASDFRETRYDLADAQVECAECGSLQNAQLLKGTYYMVPFFAPLWRIPLVHRYFLICDTCVSEKTAEKSLLVSAVDAGAVGGRQITRKEFKELKKQS